MILDPISRICEERQLSKAQFSRKSKIPYGTISCITRGLNRTMSPGTIQTIADFAKEDPEKIRQEYQEFYNEE